MSLQSCDGGTTGFPIKLIQNLFKSWPGINPSDASVNRLIAPIDFSINWAPKTNVNIAVTNTPSVFQITGLDPVTNGTTMTYGTANYNCSPILTMIQIQHANLASVWGEGAPIQEIIQAFQITNKSMNPTSPDIMLFCRPVIVINDSWAATPFWTAVNDATASKSSKPVTNFDLSSLYTFDGSTLMPMISYQTCIPVQIAGSTKPAQKGSLDIRVHVITSPLYIQGKSNGSNQCTNVTRYTLVTSGSGLSPINVFNEAGYNNIQFTTGRTSDGKSNSYPSATNTDYLQPLPPSASVRTWSQALQTFQFLIPTQFLGKSLSEIAKADSLPKPKKVNKPYKCYTIDPTRDVSGNMILIDPTTGEPLSDAVRKDQLDSAGGDAELAMALGGSPPPDPGMQPGDIEEIVVIVIGVIGGVALLAYLFYIFRFFMEHNLDEGWHHLVIFVIVFIVLFLITYLLSEDSATKLAKGKPGAAASTMVGNPKCYSNGRKLGTMGISMNDGKPALLYTKSECDKMGGQYYDRYQLCLPPTFDLSNPFLQVNELIKASFNTMCQSP